MHSFFTELRYQLSLDSDSLPPQGDACSNALLIYSKKPVCNSSTVNIQVATDLFPS